MPSIMINHPDAVWNWEPLTQHLYRITHLLQLPLFKQSAPLTSQSQARWIALIRTVGDLVRQALQAEKRIDFTEETGTLDGIQDSTSLLQSMFHSACVFRTDILMHPHLSIISSELNRIYGVGTGGFTNRLRFCCKHKDEPAFFVDQDRIYLYRHLIWAFVEAKRYPFSLPEL